MKQLSLDQMEIVEGGNVKLNVACGIAIGLLFCGPIGIIFACGMGAPTCLVAAVAK
jgi:hypothetical protein